MRGRLAVVAAVSRNRSLRRLEAAYLLFAFGEWSTYVAVIVFAYGRGGPAEAGVVAFVELAPSVVAVPAVAGLGDRYPRARVLIGSYASQAVLMATTAIALAGGAAPLAIYALATATATAVSISRPVHASLLPEVVGSPDDLTAANVVSGMAESAGSLLGPLGAGLLIAIGGPAEVFAVAAALDVLGCILIASLARRAPALDRTHHGVDAHGSPSWLAEIADGLAAIRADRRLRSVVAIAIWATFLVGALDILYAVLAIDLLDIGPSGVGYLGAVGGLGATAGAAGALLLVGRERLGFALGASAALFGGALAALAIAPGIPVAVLLLVAAGAGSALTAVAAQTLIQRLAGDDVLSRVFGILQGLAMGTTAVGSLVVPAVIGLVGQRAAFVVVGLSLPVAFLVLGRAIRAADRIAPDHAADLRLLRAIPMLGPLSAPVLERLAASATRLSAPADAMIIRAGEPGDRFYVVADGQLDVTVQGNRVRALGPGDGFGEIALVRDTPRTATVVARTRVELLALEREPFLEALTGQPRSRSLASSLADARLADDRGGA